MGAHLASIHSDAELKFVFGASGEDALSATWLGGRVSKGERETHTWSDQSAWDYSRWGTGEPRLEGDDVCVTMGDKQAGYKSRWFTAKCSQARAFVCKRSL